MICNQMTGNIDPTPIDNSLSGLEFYGISGMSVQPAGKSWLKQCLDRHGKQNQNSSCQPRSIASHLDKEMARLMKRLSNMCSNF